MNEEKEPVGLYGRFITVVSVDGGLQCGSSKLTVITPTDGNDSGTSPKKTNTSKVVSAIPTLVGVDRKPKSGNEISNEIPSYVTVVSLSEKKEKDELGIETCTKATVKSGIPVKSPKNHVNTKSFVHFRGNPSRGIDFCPDEKQFVTFSNKIKGMHARSPARELFQENEKSGEVFEVDPHAWILDEAIDIPKSIVESVTILRLPGERLGFGLRFEGGVANPTDRVRHLYIQSCAVDSPSIKAKTSWGSLGEGDEIIEIESIPVNKMTRMDCILALKDSSVAVQLLVSHHFTLDELSLLKSQREIALEKLNKNPNTAKEREIEQECKNGSIVEAINNHANDSCKPHANGLIQQLTMMGEELSQISSVSSTICNNIANSSSKIQMPRSIQQNDEQYNISPNNNNSNKGNENNKANARSHESQSESSIVYDYNENEILAFKVEENDQQHQFSRLRPPQGFTDELLPLPPQVNQSNARTDGKKSSKPVEPQFYLNAISPTHRMNSLDSFGGVESDETGSSRSTVVSRLSMTSSMSSMTQQQLSDMSCGYHPSHDHHILAKRKSSLNSLNSCPEGAALVNVGMDFENEKYKDESNENGTPIAIDAPYEFQDQQQVASCPRDCRRPTIVVEAAHDLQKPINDSAVPLCTTAFQQQVQEGMLGGSLDNANAATMTASQEVITKSNHGQALEGSKDDLDQKGILDYDDDLALLAEELGLDQEDEELLNSLVAEIDGIGVGSVVNNNLKIKESRDELIHSNESTTSEYELQMQQHHICPTYCGKGDDAHSSVIKDNKNGACCCNNEAQNNGDLFESSSDNGRLFTPFSKVVGPINNQIIKKQVQQTQNMSQPGNGLKNSGGIYCKEIETGEAGLICFPPIP